MTQVRLYAGAVLAVLLFTAGFVTAGRLPASVPAVVAGPVPVPPESAPVPQGHSVSVAPVTGPVPFPWMSMRNDGTPRTWPCGPIGYRVVLEGAPAHARGFVRGVFDRISVVSGDVFREDPPLAQSPSDYGYPGIVIAWVPQEQMSSTVAGQWVIGSGGPSWVDSGSHYLHGGVQILRDWSGSARTEFGPDSAGAVLLHELGHVLGLEHVDDPGAVMYRAARGVSTWSEPERAALRYLHDSCGG